MIKSFTLGAKKYHVKYVKERHTGGYLGKCSPDLCKVMIETIAHGEGIPELSQEQTLYHEVIHAILTEVGRDDLSSDESLVQSFSLLMHQFVKTAR